MQSSQRCEREVKKETLKLQVLITVCCCKNQGRLKNSMQWNIETRYIPPSEKKRFDLGLNACGTLFSVGVYYLTHSLPVI